MAGPRHVRGMRALRLAAGRKENCRDVIWRSRASAVGRGVARCRPPPIAFRPRSPEKISVVRRRRRRCCVASVVSLSSLHVRKPSFRKGAREFRLSYPNVRYACTSVLPSRNSFAIFRCGGFKGAAWSWRWFQVVKTVVVVVVVVVWCRLCVTGKRRATVTSTPTCCRTPSRPNTPSLSALGLSGGPDVPHAAIVAKRNREGRSGMGKLIESELSVLEWQPVHEYELLEDVDKQYAVRITFRMQITADVDIQWDTILSGRKLYIQVSCPFECAQPMLSYVPFRRIVVRNIVFWRGTDLFKI